MINNSKNEIWKERVTDYRSSNLKAQDWCDKNNLSIKTLRYWVRKINKEAITCDNTTHEFVPITTSEIMRIPAAPVIIRFGNISIDVSDGCHPDTYRNVLEALRIYA